MFHLVNDGESVAGQIGDESLLALADALVHELDCLLLGQIRLVLLIHDRVAEATREAAEKESLQINVLFQEILFLILLPRNFALQ